MSHFIYFLMLDLRACGWTMYVGRCQSKLMHWELCPGVRGKEDQFPAAELQKAHGSAAEAISWLHHITPSSRQSL